jgi:hypothetical protein
MMALERFIKEPSMKISHFSLFITCLLPGLALAGHGMFLQINSYLPQAELTIDANQCILLPRQLHANQTFYIETDTKTLACWLKTKRLSLSLWTTNPVRDKVVSYVIAINDNAATLRREFVNNQYHSSAQLFPKYSLIGSQELVLSSSSNINPQDWLAEVNPSLPLKQLALAGTHDSGTATISAASPLTNDAPSAIAKLYQRGGEVARRIIAGWGKSQELNTTQQLQQGIRYFDLRLCGSSAISSITTCHGVAGEKLSEVIRQVQVFNQAHPQEIIFLDFNHWYPKNTSEDTMRQSVYSYLINTLGARLALKGNYSLDSRLADFWRQQQGILIFSDNNTNQPGVWLSKQVHGADSLAQCQVADLCSLWPVTTNADDLKQVIRASASYLRATLHQYLFVMQGQVTPTPTMIIDSLKPGSEQPGSLLKLTGTYKDEILQELRTPGLFANAGGVIFIEDFSTGIDLVAIAKQLNSQPSSP